MSFRSWAPPVWLSFALLLGSSSYLLWQWSSHPVPVPGSEVIGPIILLSSGIVVNLMLEGIVYLNSIQLKGETNQQLTPEANELLSRVTLDIVRIVDLALAIPFSVITTGRR